MILTDDLVEDPGTQQFGERGSLFQALRDGVVKERRNSRAFHDDLYAQVAAPVMRSAPDWVFG